MPIARVQTKSAHSSPGTSVSLILNSATTSSNLLVVCASCYYAGANAGGTWTLSDNKGNTWTSAVVQDITSRMQVFYAENINGGPSHQITLSVSGASTYLIITAIEYSGVLTSSSLDKTAISITSGSVSAYASPSTATTSQADEVLIGVHHAYQSAATPTPATNWNTIVTQAGAGFHTHTVQERIVSATGAYSSSGTWSQAGANHVDSIVTFKAAGGGGTTYTYGGSGQVSLSGNASFVRLRQFSGGGSATLSGTAATSRIRAIAGAGTTVLSGASAASRVRASAGTGTVAFSGSAATSFVPAGSNVNNYTGSGQIFLLGSASLVRARTFAASGLLAFSGAAISSRVRVRGGAGFVNFSGFAATSGPSVSVPPSLLRTMAVTAEARLVLVATESRTLSA